MATEGDLKDLGLANLIQSLCLDQRNTLIRLKHRQQNGLIACNGGEIVHAQVGPVQGDEAIYELLSWTEAKFQLIENATPSPQTITQSWSALLMEGMRRLDERRANESTKTPPVWSPEDSTKDSELENKLILLLASLEQMRVKLGSKEAQKNTLLAAQILADLVNRAAQFSETEFWATEMRHAGDGRNTLELILLETESEFPLARLLEIRNYRLAISAISKLYSLREGEQNRRRENLRELTRAMIHMLEQYLGRFLSAFRTPHARTECEDAVNIFVADLTNMVDQLSF
ncbi:MAG: DUF4388 domain-containing protein [Chloroflexi bacterium]|nr:DUF4388 domain-containing protein [Chloroflexota bacterium]